MEQIIYKEEQSFRQTFIPWIMLAACLLIIGNFSIGLYKQFYLGQPYGDEPMSDAALLWSSIISFIVMNAAFIFLLHSSLITEIWSDGIRYKFPLLIRKTRHIPLSEIVSVEVTKYSPILEFGGWGWRKRLFSRKAAYSVSGRIGIRVIKNNESQVVFGTQKKDEMKRAVEKMMRQNINKY